MCAIREYFHFNRFKVDTWIHSYINDLRKWKLNKTKNIWFIFAAYVHKNNDVLA